MAIRHDEQMIVNGKLTQVGVSFRTNVFKARSAVFKCNCGQSFVTLIAAVKNKHTQSCGCHKRTVDNDKITEVNKTGKHIHLVHGMCGTSEYKTWVSVRSRCYDVNNTAYQHYGGRGITVCDRWREFDMFLQDMGNRPDGLTIDRINNDGNYEPNNCRWATWAQQSRNRRNNRTVVVGNKTYCITDAAAAVGISRSVVSGRIHRGWSIEDALKTPVKIRKT